MNYLLQTKKNVKVFFAGAVSTHAILDHVPNKGFALLAAGQFETRLQEFGLWGS